MLLVFLMAQIHVSCPHCGEQKSIVGNGKARRTGFQRYFCRSCQRYFQLDYLNQGCTPNIHERIVTLTMEGLGVRAIARVLKISLTTVIKHLKKIEPTATHRRSGANRKTEGHPANR